MSSCSLVYSITFPPKHCYISFSMAQQPLVGHGLIIIEASHSHSDTRHSVRLLWTSDQPDAENSIWQHTTLTKDRHPCPGEIRTYNPSKRTVANPRLRPRGHWDQNNTGTYPTKNRHPSNSNLHRYRREILKPHVVVTETAQRIRKRTRLHNVSSLELHVRKQKELSLQERFCSGCYR
jgi:hypothetical protein